MREGLDDGGNVLRLGEDLDRDRAGRRESRDVSRWRTVTSTWTVGAVGAVGASVRWRAGWTMVSAWTVGTRRSVRRGWTVRTVRPAMSARSAGSTRSTMGRRSVGWSPVAVPGWTTVRWLRSVFTLVVLEWPPRGSVTLLLVVVVTVRSSFLLAALAVLATVLSVSRVRVIMLAVVFVVFVVAVVVRWSRGRKDIDVRRDVTGERVQDKLSRDVERSLDISGESVDLQLVCEDVRQGNVSISGDGEVVELEVTS